MKRKRFLLPLFFPAGICPASASLRLRRGDEEGEEPEQGTERKNLLLMSFCQSGRN